MCSHTAFTCLALLVVVRRTEAVVLGCVVSSAERAFRICRECDIWPPAAAQKRGVRLLCETHEIGRTAAGRFLHPVSLIPSLGCVAHPCFLVHCLLVPLSGDIWYCIVLSVIVLYRQSTTSYHVSPVLSRTSRLALKPNNALVRCIHLYFSSFCTALLDPRRRGTSGCLHLWEDLARVRTLLTMTLVRPGPSTAAMRLCRRWAMLLRGRNGQRTLGPAVPSGEGIAA